MEGVMKELGRWNLGYVACIECGKMFREISEAHCRSHGLSQAQYREKYGIPKGTKLNFTNLSRIWQLDASPEYKGQVKVYDFCGERIDCKANAHIKFNLDYVSGELCWAGDIDDIGFGTGINMRRHPFFTDVTGLRAIRLDTGEKHLVQILGADHVGQSYSFESAWPSIINDTKLVKNMFKLDPRVIEIMKRHDVYIPLRERWDDCKDDREELHFLTYNQYNKEESLEHYAMAKDIIRRLDENSAAELLRIHEELIDIREEHMPIDVYAVRNLIWFTRPDIHNHFIKDGRLCFRSTS
jgi:hypothetical protein